MNVDNPTQAFGSASSGVAASMHAPSPAITTSVQSKLGKRNQSEAELDERSDEEDRGDSIAVELNLNTTNFAERSIIVAPSQARRYDIDGAHPRAFFSLLTRIGRTMWLQAPNNENAICAFIPGDRFPANGDPSASVRIICNTAVYITRNNSIDVLPATPDRPEDGEDAVYIICYLINLTDQDNIILLSHPLFCTPEGTIATFELNFTPNAHVGTWGQSCLTNDPNHVRNPHYSNIPF